MDATLLKDQYQNVDLNQDGDHESNRPSSQLLSPQQATTEGPNDNNNNNNHSRLLKVLLLTGGSITGFSLIHWITSQLWKRGMIVDVDRLRALRLNKSDSINLSEKVVSTLHATITATLAYDLVFGNDRFFSQRPEKGGNIWTTYPMKESDIMFSISLGYSIYDSIVMLIQKSSDTSMWLHHVLEIAGCALSMWYKQTTVLSTAMLFTEVTVLPTNVQWFVTKLGSRRSRSYKVVSLLKMIFFICFRLGVGPLFFYRAVAEGHLKTFRELPIMAQLLSFFITVCLSYLNIVWTSKVCKNTLRTLGTCK